MTDELNKLIQQAELRKKQLQLSDQFNRNMQFLSQAAPDLYTQFKDYSPVELQLAVRDDGDVDLLNLKSNKYVYQTSIQNLHQQAVDDFFNTPRHYHVNYEPMGKQLATHEPYIVHTNAAIEKLNESFSETKNDLDLRTMKLLVVAGVGLGNHLPILLERSDVRNLFILEPDEDLFYASLHTVEWPKIAEYFAREGYSLNLQVGQAPDKAIQVLTNHLAEIGPHNAVTIYLFDLLQTQKVSESTRHLLQQLTRSLTVQGYLDDERVGFAQTINNIKNGVPALTYHARLSGKQKPLPVFVLGNGPSLDKAEAFLRANQHRAILISCGTTLGSLERMRISPDFHVEQERPRVMREWLESSTSEEFRRPVCLVGMNTVHPEVYGLFDRKAMFMKPNDLGSTYSQKLVKKGKHIIQLPFSNPTVTNAGLSLAVALGFSNIYLIGIDYGSPNHDSHHSRHSAHYRLKPEHEQIFNTQGRQARNSQVEGNFGGKVETTRILNLARMSAEDLFSQYPEFNYLNTSEGARIKGAAPTKYTDIQLEDFSTQKETLVDDLLNRHFSSEPFDQTRLTQRIQSDFKPASKALRFIVTLLDKPVQTEEEASDLVDRIQTYLNNLPRQSTEEQSVLMLIKGSINMFNMLLQSSINRGAGTGKTPDLFQFIAGEYRAYLYSALDQLRNQLLENDQRLGNVSEAMDKPQVN